MWACSHSTGWAEARACQGSLASLAEQVSSRVRERLYLKKYGSLVRRNRPNTDSGFHKHMHICVHTHENTCTNWVLKVGCSLIVSDLIRKSVDSVHFDRRGHFYLTPW